MDGLKSDEDFLLGEPDLEDVLENNGSATGPESFQTAVASSQT